MSSRRLASLPRGLDRSDVDALLTSCNRNTITGCRDFAILTMLARLGLRVGEVARLDLDDIDWRSGDVIIRGKGSRIERLPLPHDVGDAVAAYLVEARPKTMEDRAIFVRVPAPHRRMTYTGVTLRVAAAARRAGLGRMHGHRLRHTAATEILRAGGSLREVGQLLRHRDLKTTAVYAKVDRNTLRSLTRPWPGDLA